MKVLNTYEDLSSEWQKGALHLHSTNSDGSNTPREVIEDYERLGFDFIGFTDHNTVQPKDVFDVETNMVVINGCEYRGAKWKGEIGVIGCSDDLVYQKQTVQEYFNHARESNGFITYNHPNWNFNHWSSYEMFLYKGPHALEIFNGVGDELGGDPVSTNSWDQVLTAGKTLWGIATDDAHHHEHRNNGWVMVNSDKKQENIIEALKAGKFYSSTGVTIDSIKLDGRILKVSSKDARTIKFIAHNGSVVKEVEGENGEYTIKEEDVYIRVEFYGNKQEKAYTNPIFIESEQSDKKRYLFKKYLLKMTEKGGKSEHLLMFDFDGVLGDTLEMFHEKFNKVCEMRGHDMFKDRKVFLGLFDHNVFENMKNLGVIEKDIPIILKNLSESFNQDIDKVSLFSGIAEMLNFLCDLHPVYVVTSNLSSIVSSVLKANGVHGIKEVIGSDKNPSKIEKIRSLIDKYPMHIPFYIGDTKGDMIESHLARARSIGVLWGWHGEELRKTWPNYIAAKVEDLQDIIT